MIARPGPAAAGAESAERVLDAEHADEFWERRLALDDTDDAGPAPVAPPAVAPPERPGPTTSWWPWLVVLLAGLGIGFALGRWSAGPPSAPAPQQATVPAAAAPEPAILGESPGLAQPPVAAPVSPTATEARDTPLVPTQGGAAPPASVAPTGTPARTDARPAPAAPARPAEGRLLVRSSPSGARVKVNGTDRGTTPLTVRGLAPGRYTVETLRKGFVADSRRIEITSRQPSRSVDVTLKAVSGPAPPLAPRPAPTSGSLEFVTRPVGARVFVDGQPIGSAPLKLLEVPPGTKLIRLELAGHKTWTASITIAAGEARRVAASLEPLP